jgi:hypothetical protein
MPRRDPLFDGTWDRSKGEGRLGNELFGSMLQLFRNVSISALLAVGPISMP